VEELNPGAPNNDSSTLAQPCQNVPVAGNFAIYRQSSASCSTLEFPRKLLADRKTQSLLPTSSGMLPATANHLDRAASYYSTTAFTQLYDDLLVNNNKDAIHSSPHLIK